MVTLRNFEPGDAPALQKSQYPDMSLSDIEVLIRDWGKKEVQGRYFEQFAIVDGENIVGMVSLWQLASHTISCGPEIFPACRRNGYAKAAMSLALELARTKGFRIALHQVAVSNAASVALHRALGFESDEYIYRNKKGREVLIFCKSLV